MEDILRPGERLRRESTRAGRLLNEVSSLGRVVAIVPNIGLTKTSLFLGTSFQGVKGFAIVVEKSS